jgi:hypothetical protein
MGEEAPALFLTAGLVRTHRAARMESRTRAGQGVSALPTSVLYLHDIDMM